jgi:MGT family glycosyltransferase
VAHFGIICPPVPGHVDPLAALGRTLSGRGHRVTFFHVSDLGPKIHAEGLEFVALGPDRFPAGTLQASVRQLAALKGIASLKFAIECECRISSLILDYGPEAIAAGRVDALLVDQNEPAGGTVAEHLNLPFVSTCTSLPLNREADIPPPFVGWSFRPGPFGQMRNRLGYAISDRFIAPIQRTLNDRRRQWSLPPLASPDDSFSTRAQIAQMPREFDFPRRRLPPAFHYTGPWFDDRLNSVSFPFDRLDGRPMVYGSLGTLQPEQSPYFGMMAEACCTLDVQLVLSLGKTESVEVMTFPGNPVVVPYAPQPALLSRAAATITHSGMNTTQQSLFFGTPLVAIPLAHDQPAIAARTARSGAGIVISPKDLGIERLRSAMREVIQPNGTYHAHAGDIQRASQQAGGCDRAATIIESAISW